MEITTYLQKQCAGNEHDLNQLEQFPLVKELFKKCNAICTSSAAAERLFSYAGKFSFKDMIFNDFIVFFVYFHRFDFGTETTMHG